MNHSIVNETETVELASRLAGSLKPGAVVALSGSLGSGKSVFCRALMRALGVTDEALPSPSFSVIQEYNADGCKIAHMDWYRLDDVGEIEMLGVREYFHPPWICLIEWPERASELVTTSAISICLSISDLCPDARTIEITNISNY